MCVTKSPEGRALFAAGPKAEVRKHNENELAVIKYELSQLSASDEAPDGSRDRRWAHLRNCLLENKSADIFYEFV